MLFVLHHPSLSFVKKKKMLVNMLTMFFSKCHKKVIKISPSASDKKNQWHSISNYVKQAK